MFVNYSVLYITFIDWLFPFLIDMLFLSIWIIVAGMLLDVLQEMSSLYVCKIRIILRPVQ